jgi:hypothetical protein
MALPDRLLANCGIDQLEQLFDEKREQKAFLETLLVELSFRSTKRAKLLKKRVMQALGVSDA